MGCQCVMWMTSAGLDSDRAMCGLEPRTLVGRSREALFGLGDWPALGTFLT